MPTQQCVPHPIGIGSKSRGYFSPTTFLRGPKEPRCKGQPLTHLRRPRLVNKGGSSPTLRSMGPHKQKLPSPPATLQTRPPQPHIRGQTHSLRPHPCEYEAALVHAHVPLAGATPILSLGLSLEDGSPTSTPAEHAKPRLVKRPVVSDTPRPPPPQGGPISIPALPAGLSILDTSRPNWQSGKIAILPDPDSHLSTSPQTGLDEITSTPDLSDLPRPRPGQTGTHILAILQTPPRRS